MSREQEPESPEAERNARGHLELEEKEPGRYRDDDTHKLEDRSLLDHGKSSLHLQDDLQKNKVNSAEDNNFCQSLPTEEEDETSDSDSDSDDNITVIIGIIKTCPNMFMEKLTNVNSQTGKDFGISASGSAKNTTTE